MAGLENIPQQNQITIETVKLDDTTLTSINELQQTLNGMVASFGQMYLRKREISDELIRIDDTLERAEDEFKGINAQLREVFEALDEKYPQGRVNLQDGTIQYQPGAPTRKQMAEQQQQQTQQSQMKVVKE